MFGSRARAVALSIAAVFVAGSAGAAETRSFVVSYFTDANWSDGKSDCPNGTNPSSIDFYRRDLARLGLPKDKIEAALKDFPGEGGLQQPWVPLVMTRGNGKDNVYVNPETMPDLNTLKLVQGKYAYGFNLDGKGAKSPNSFEEPDTHEKGINNQLYRVQGCIHAFHGLPAPGRPSLPENLWDVLRDVAPAWIVSVTSPTSLTKDGDVTVTIDRALQTITRDASGAVAQADLTYQIDPDARSHNAYKAKIKGGVIESTEPVDFFVVSDPYLITEYDLKKSKLRLKLNADGTLRGVIGGYIPWRTMYYAVASQGHIKEYATSIDAPSLYYALKKNADFDPDPTTKENRRISTAFTIEAVRAFVAPLDSKTAQVTQ